MVGGDLEWGTLIKGKPFSVSPTAFAHHFQSILSTPGLLYKKLVSQIKQK